MIDYGKFRLSLARLIEQHANFEATDHTVSRLDREARAESVIQRFEVCYDCLWKVLKRYLMKELGLVDPPNSPKPLLRLARENHLLNAPIAHWFRYADARTDTTHDYDGAKARACVALVPEFIADAIGLYETMSGATWE